LEQIFDSWIIGWPGIGDPLLSGGIPLDKTNLVLITKRNQILRFGFLENQGVWNFIP